MQFRFMKHRLMKHFTADPMRKADEARDSGNYARAADLYGKVRPTDPRYFDALVQRANMLKDTGRLDEARASYFEPAAV